MGGAAYAGGSQNKDPALVRRLKLENGVREGLDWRCRDECVAKVGGLALEPLVLALVVFGFEGGEDGIVVGAGSLTS